MNLMGARPAIKQKPLSWRMIQPLGRVEPGLGDLAITCVPSQNRLLQVKLCSDTDPTASAFFNCDMKSF